jgi:hypothetical protein
MVRNSRSAPVRTYVLCFERSTRGTGAARRYGSGETPAAQNDGAGMEAQATRRILKRACPAQVMEAVIFKKPANFGGVFWRGFGCGEPALDFRSEIVDRGDRTGFQTRIAEKFEQFADGKSAHVRGVAQNFPFVLIGGAIGMFARVDIFDEYSAAGATDAGHFAEHAERRLQMMQSEAADDYVKAGIFKGKSLRIGGAKRDVGDAALLRAFFGDGKHGVGEIDADDFSREAGEGFGDVAGAGGDVEHALVTAKMCGGD